MNHANHRGMPEPDKIIALIRADNCKLETIKPQVNAIGEALARNKLTAWVAVNFAAWPDNNVDPWGRPAWYVAALEVKAPAAVLPEIISDVQESLGSRCRVDCYSTYENRVIAPSRTWPLGRPSPGGKSFYFIFRKEEMPVHEFFYEWAVVMAQIMMIDRGPGAEKEGRRYIQSLVIARTPNDSRAIDGIKTDGGLSPPTAESIRALQAAINADPQKKKRKDAYAPTFTDIDKMSVWAAEEIILKD